ncbi:MAG: TMEM165/GDT1 family protein [Coriobacteriia bacterium]|nr:TMEM165/GDT1 family protein [Coriobacteriia bacterium]MBN2839563.1 TMEM165/GDT1 family protein [Coriobacteriia bacterium]
MGAAFLIAFVLVGLAELGDKSQLLLLGFSARYRPVKVVIGAALAIALLQALGVLAGGLIGAYLPERVVAVVAGLLFIGFGVASWRVREEGPAREAERMGRFGPVLTVAAALFIGELGDKTQVMTMSIAADPAASIRALGAIGAGLTAPTAGTFSTGLGVWLGSSLGFLLADMVAIVGGALLGSRLPERMISRASAVVFVLFGVITLLSAFVV